MLLAQIQRLDCCSWFKLFGDDELVKPRDGQPEACSRLLEVGAFLTAR